MLGITSFGIAGLRPTQYIVVRRSKGGRPRTPRKRLEPPGQGGPSGCHDPVKDEAVASAEFRSWRMQKAVRVPTSGRMVFDLVWAFCARRFRLSKVMAWAAPGSKRRSGVIDGPCPAPTVGGLLPAAASTSPTGWSRSCVLGCGAGSDCLRQGVARGRAVARQGSRRCRPRVALPADGSVGRQLKPPARGALRSASAVPPRSPHIHRLEPESVSQEEYA